MTTGESRLDYSDELLDTLITLLTLSTWAPDLIALITLSLEKITDIIPKSHREVSSPNNPESQRDTGRALAGLCLLGSSNN